MVNVEKQNADVVLPAFTSEGLFPQSVRAYMGTSLIRIIIHFVQLIPLHTWVPLAPKFIQANLPRNWCRSRFLRISVYLVIYDSGWVSLEHLQLSWYPSQDHWQILVTLSLALTPPPPPLYLSLLTPPSSSPFKWREG